MDNERKKLEHLLRMWPAEKREQEIAKRLGEDQAPDSNDSLAQQQAEEPKKEELEAAEKKAKKAAKAKATRAANKAKKEAAAKEEAE